MLHVIPIVCVLGFFGFMEFRLGKEMERMRNEIDKLKTYHHEDSVHK